MAFETTDGAGRYRGLLVDWGGVMTSSVFGAFEAFCHSEGLSADAVSDLFRHDRDCRELLIGLETGGISEEAFELRFAAFLGVSAPGVISGEVGMRKPAPEIYLLGAEQIGVDPDRCVFVDDLPFNLEPAAELGMATVHHRDAQRTIGELEELLAVELR
jgi:hypothetical protein